MILNFDRGYAVSFYIVVCSRSCSCHSTMHTFV